MKKKIRLFTISNEVVTRKQFFDQLKQIQKEGYPIKWEHGFDELLKTKFARFIYNHWDPTKCRIFITTESIGG